MATVKQLQEQAKGLGIKNLKSLKKAELEEAIAAATGPGSGGDSEGAPDSATPEEASAAPAAEDTSAPAANPESSPAAPLAPVGVPTEPDKGGLTAAERAAFEPRPAPAVTTPPPSGPSITGSYQKGGKVGVPTEPERGGLTDAEKALHGVT